MMAIKWHILGKKFIRATGKRKDVETVIDILITTNLKGEIVKTRYVASHEFAGQTIIDNDIPLATIMRAEIVS